MGALGSVSDVYERARHPYTMGLLGAVPRVDGTAERLHPIAGAPPTLIDLPTGCRFAPRCHLATDLCHQDDSALRQSTGESGPMAVARHYAV